MLKFYLYPGINKSRWLSDPDYLPLFAPHYLLFEFLSLIWHRTYFAICCICISHVLPAVVVPCVGVHNQSSPSLLKHWCRLSPLCCLSRFISFQLRFHFKCCCYRKADCGSCIIKRINTDLPLTQMKGQ